MKHIFGKIFRIHRQAVKQNRLGVYKMKKVGFVMGCISTLLGAMTIIVTTILNELIPKIGYAMYQSAAAGSY